MSELPDQQQIWDACHLRGDHDRLRGFKSRFAKEVSGYLPAQARILELGCGVGSDAAYFARQGHTVLACDFSTTVIERNRREIEGVEFFVADIADPFSFEDSSFDLVYAHLSLHYYADEATRSIFAEISRLCRPGGVFAFACKSVNDWSFGRGAQLEKNYFQRPRGVPLHLFDKDYVQELLGGSFEILSLAEHDQEFNGERSAVLYCIAELIDRDAVRRSSHLS